MKRALTPTCIIWAIAIVLSLIGMNFGHLVWSITSYVSAFLIFVGIIVGWITLEKFKWKE